MLDSFADMSLVANHCARLGLEEVASVSPGPRAADGVPAWPQLVTGSCVATHQARQAIYLFCKASGIGPGDEVLMPAYNCGTEVDAVLSTGASVCFYQVDDEARIDVDDVQRRMTSRTRLVYVTHYFGWPQDVRELSLWCRRHSLLLFEDCALSLFSNGPDGPLGHVGDAAVFSLPKTLPVPDGGVLVARQMPCISRPMASPQPGRIIRRCASLLKRNIEGRLWRLGAPSLRWCSGPRDEAEPKDPIERFPDMPRGYYYDTGKSDWGMSWPTRAAVRRVDPEWVARRRRRSYLDLMNAVQGVAGLVPLFDRLPLGVCPLAFPVRVHDRHEWLRELASLGIDAIPWWAGYHRDLSWHGFSNAQSLKNGLLALPIHQQLDREQIRHIGDCVRRTASILRRAGAT